MRLLEMLCSPCLLSILCVDFVASGAKMYIVMSFVVFVALEC